MSRLDEYVESTDLADGVTVSSRLSRLYPYTCFYVQCLDADNNPVAPTSGTVTVEISEDGVSYGSIPDGTISLNTSYNRPSVGCPFMFARMSISDVTADGATKVRLVLQRFD